MLNRDDWNCRFFFFRNYFLFWRNVTQQRFVISQQTKQMSNNEMFFVFACSTNKTNLFGQSLQDKFFSDDLLLEQLFKTNVEFLVVSHRCQFICRFK